MAVHTHPVTYFMVALCFACKPPPVTIPITDEVDPVAVTDVALTSGFQDYEVGDQFKRGRGCSAVDFDNDGRIDVMLANPADESHILHNITEPGGPILFESHTLLDESALIWNGSAADYDNDGDLDLFLGVGGMEGRGFDRLLRNDLIETGAWSFTDITDAAGVAGPFSEVFDEVVETATAGSNWVDFDNDGRLDLFTSGHVYPLNLWNNLPDGAILGRNTLWRQQEDGTFEDVTESVNLNTRYPTRFSTWLDFDQDGDMDLFENVWDVQPNVLWRNDLAETGVATFSDVTVALSGPGTDLRYPPETFVSATEDFNADGWPDLLLFVRGWSSEGPHIDGHTLLLNAGGTAFVDASEASKLNRPFAPGYRSHVSLGVMGASVGDLNGDGLADVFIGNGGPTGGYANQLFVTQGLEAVEFEGVGELWVPQFENWSAYIDTPSEQSDEAPSYPPYPYRTHGACMADFDGDGQLELAVTNGGMSYIGGDAVKEPNRLFQFDVTAPHAFVQISLRGDGQTTPRSPIGARVAVTATGESGASWTRYRTVLSQNGFAAQDPYAMIVGLGEAKEIDAIDITWPGLTEQSLSPPALGEAIEVLQ
jgi:hypothetical protein